MLKFFQKLFHINDKSIAQPEGTISVLLNGKSKLNDRCIAAQDLAMYDEKEAEGALLLIVGRTDIPHVLLQDCGKSLAEIWWRKKHYKSEVVKTFMPYARKSFEKEYGYWSANINNEGK